MKKHLVLSSKDEFKEVISGERRFLIRFFRKRQEFLSQVKSGDLVFLKVGREILGQFITGKVIIVEKIEVEDLGWIKEIHGIENILENVDFEETVEKNELVLIVEIIKFEQLITSPIEVPIVRKDWVILED